jgi:uncharacterized membrane protein YkoI
MNSRIKLGIAMLAVPLLCLTATVQASQSAKHQAQELQRMKLSLIEAIVVAEKEGAGKATGAEFYFKGGNPAVFHVTVLSADGKKLTRYDLDPRTGRVLHTHNEVLEKLLTRITPESLRQAPTTLTHAIRLAQEHSKGHARSADVDRKGDHLQYDIETVQVDGTSHTVKVDSANGQVISDDAER